MKIKILMNVIIITAAIFLIQCDFGPGDSSGPDYICDFTGVDPAGGNTTDLGKCIEYKADSNLVTLIDISCTNGGGVSALSCPLTELVGTCQAEDASLGNTMTVRTKYYLSYFSTTSAESDCTGRGGLFTPNP